MLILISDPQFKKFLLLTYYSILSDEPRVWKTRLVDINYAVFSQHKFISHFIDTNQIKPFRININSETLPEEWTFGDVVDVYRKYMGVLKTIVGSNEEIAKKYTKWALEEGNIVDWSGYEIFLKEYKADIIQEYFVEYHYLDFLAKMLINVREEKLTILKAIKDVVNYLKTRKDAD